jgi:ankyrin repeat protein
MPVDRGIAFRYARCSDMAIPTLSDTRANFVPIGLGSAGRGDLEAVAWLLAQRPHWLSHRGSHGRSMLWEASWRGRLNVAQYLADRGADINAIGCHYTPIIVEITPYCAARVKRHEAVAEFLLSRGAAVGVHTAAYLGDVDAVSRLIGEQPDLLEALCLQDCPEPGPDGETDYGTPLCYAVCGGNLEVARLLVDRGAEVRRHSWHFLRYAGDDAAMLRLLLENGADPAKAQPPTAPDTAAARVLAEYGVHADPNRADHGWPPLVYICRGDRGGNRAEVQRLIDAGADLAVRNSKGKTALHVAAKSGFAPATEALLAAGADPNATDPAGETPLFEVVRSTIKRTERRLAVASLLVAAGADASHPNDEGLTALGVAIKLSRRPPQELLATLRVAES